MSEMPFVGIDVSKATLDVHVRPLNQDWKVPNSSSGRKRLLQALLPLQPERIVMEATGRLEQPLARLLHQAALPVVVVNPRKVRHFAKCLGKEAKTDPIDARTLAHFGDAIRPTPRAILSVEETELQECMSFRRSLIAQVAAYKNQHKAHPVKVIRDAIQHLMGELQDQIAALDAFVEAQIARVPERQALFECVQSVPGVGRITGMTLVAELKELGSLSNREISALVGVAPFNHDSGKLQGKRAIGFGRASVRAALYMATLSAVRHEPGIRAFYLRLKAKGKKSKVVLTACLRKLLCLLNSMVRNGEFYQRRVALTA